VAASRAVTVALGSGQNTFKLDLHGQFLEGVNQTPGATYQFTVFGGPGRDVLQARGYELSLPTASHLGLRFLGGAGDDRLSVNLANLNTTGFFPNQPLTPLDVTVDGQDGNDRVAIALSGHGDTNTGTIHAVAQGGSGKDVVALLADVTTFLSSSEAVLMPIDAVLDGGSGCNTTLHTANVVPHHVQRDLLV
jgi:hypothetical protein